MRIVRLAALSLAAMLVTPAAAAPRPNWIATVHVTASGSHVLGNPDAKVKLTEYVSYTCPHCAQFHTQGDGPLRIAYVFPGKVSVEVRHMVRDPVDMTAALLANCGAPSRFFGNHAAFMASQDKWLGTIDSASAAQKQRWTTGPALARFRAIASDFGFYRIMEQRGYDRPAADRCLADEAMARKLAEQTSKSAELGVEGTPSFLLDGVLLSGTHDWRALEVQIKARL